MNKIYYKKIQVKAIDFLIKKSAYKVLLSNFFLLLFIIASSILASCRSNNKPDDENINSIKNNKVISPIKVPNRNLKGKLNQYSNKSINYNIKNINKQNKYNKRNNNDRLKIKLNLKKDGNNKIFNNNRNSQLYGNNINIDPNNKPNNYLNRPTLSSNYNRIESGNNNNIKLINHRQSNLGGLISRNNNINNKFNTPISHNKNMRQIDIKSTTNSNHLENPTQNYNSLSNINSNIIVSNISDGTEINKKPLSDNTNRIDKNIKSKNLNSGMGSNSEENIINENNNDKVNNIEHQDLEKDPQKIGIKQKELSENNINKDEKYDNEQNPQKDKDEIKEINNNENNKDEINEELIDNEIDDDNDDNNKNIKQKNKKKLSNNKIKKKKKHKIKKKRKNKKKKIRKNKEQNILDQNVKKYTEDHKELIDLMKKNQGLYLKLVGPIQKSFFKLLNFLIKKEDIKNLDPYIANKILKNIKYIQNINKKSPINDIRPGSLTNNIILLYEEVKNDELKNNLKKELSIDIDRLSEAFKLDKIPDERTLKQDINYALNYMIIFNNSEEGINDQQLSKKIKKIRRKAQFLMLLQKIIHFYFTKALAENFKQKNVAKISITIHELNNHLSNKIDYYNKKGINVNNSPLIKLAIEINKFISNDLSIKRKVFNNKVKNKLSFNSPIKINFHKKAKQNNNQIINPFNEQINDNEGKKESKYKKFALFRKKKKNKLLAKNNEGIINE